MQIVFLIIFSSLVFAQKGGRSPECDPVEVERECYTRLCSSTPERVIPTNKDELIKAATSMPYTLSPEVKKDSDKLVSLATNILGNANQSIESGGLKKISEELLSDPFANFNLIETFFRGSFNCVKTEGKCTLVSSDLDEYPSEMKELYKKWYEDTFILRGAVFLDASQMRRHINTALEKSKNELSKKEFKDEGRNIRRLKSPTDFFHYFAKAPWFVSYRSRVASDLVKSASVLENAIKIKITDMSKTPPSDIQKKMTISCQLANYLKTTLDQHATQEKFEAEKKKAIELFTSKFLPKLSADSAVELKARLHQDSIQMMKLDINTNPFTPNFGRHKDGYQMPIKNSEMIEDLILIQNSDTHQCNVKSLLPTDVFMQGSQTVFVSKYTLANGLSNVITHELGHWLSAQMINKSMSSHSLRKLKKVRKCVKSFYPREKRPSSFLNSFKDDHVFVEEDFADWFTAVAGAKEPGLYCDLGKILSNFGVPHSEMTYTPTDGDTHSGLLFREMTLRLNRNETLPQSCRDLMSVHPSIQPKKCEW